MVNVKFTGNRKTGLSDNGTETKQPIDDSLLREKNAKCKIKEYNEDNMKYTVKVEFIILCLILNTGMKIGKALALTWD